MITLTARKKTIWEKFLEQLPDIPDLEDHGWKHTYMD